MRTDNIHAQLLPKLLTAMLVSSSLLLGACSNNDVNEISADNTTDEVDTNAVDANAVDANAVDANAVDANDAAANESDATLATENQTTVTDTDTTTVDLVEPKSAASAGIDSPLVSPEQPSLVNNPTQAGTPEDTVKQALDTLYYGDVKQAATYYKVDIANFEQELANTQSAFQQTVEGVTITDTTYNDDKTRATIDGELMLKGQKQPVPLSYELQKIAGKWKILG